MICLPSALASRRLVPAMLALVALAPAGCAYRQHIERGSALMTQAHYPEALSEFNAAKDQSFHFSDEEARAQAAAARVAWAAELDERATALQAEHPGAAWLLALKAAELDPANGAARARATAIRPRLLAQADYPVAARPAGERARAALAAIGGGLGGRATLRLDFDPKGADRAGLRLAVGEASFARDRRTEERSVTYQSGVRTFPNPDVPARMADVDRLRMEFDHARLRTQAAESDYRRADADSNRADADYDQLNARMNRGRERDEQRWDENAKRQLDRQKDRRDDARRDRDRARDERDRAREARDRAERDLRAASDALAATPPFLSEPEMSTLTFPAQIRTLRAMAAVTGQIDHADGRPPIVIDTTVSVGASAETHAAYPVAGVAPVDERLPSEPTLAEGLTGRAAGEARDALRRSFASFRDEILRTADRAGSEEDQLDHLAVYVLSDPDHVSGDARRKIDQLAEAFAKIPNATGLMTAR